MESFSLTRRSFLQAAGIGASALATGSLAQVLGNRNDVHLRLISQAASLPILPGNLTNAYRYTGSLRMGPRGTVQNLSSCIGPIIRLESGQNVQIDHLNSLTENTVVHFHGMNVPELADGHPKDVLAPGELHSHRFRVINRAGTYWFHPHPDMRTGYQVHRGMAGMMIVHDAEERALGLPSGACDVPVVIQDKRFNASNQFQHSTGSQTGHLGSRILINGFADYVWNCGTRLYRFRFLNGCNSRILKLAWDDGQPMTVIGTDGGLLSEPVVKPYVMLGPGQRIEVIGDFTTKSVGSQIKLKSLAYLNGGPGSGTPPQGTEMDLMVCNVNYQTPESVTIPSILTPIVRYDRNAAVNAATPRMFATEYMNGMWTINGRTFEMLEVADEEKVRLNDLEVWEMRNDLPADQFQPHPMHLHGPMFQIHKRWTNEDTAWYETISEGYVDEGWHDTVLLFPGERAEFMLKFGPYPGLFLMHCHNLEHEDMGMMRNYQILP